MAQRLREVMTTDVEVVGPDDTAKHAAIKMEALNVGALPVCDGERLVGMLTDRDIAIRVVARGVDPNTASVRETMTPEVVYCMEDQPVDEAAQLMKDREIRRLPILNRDKRLIGMVSLGDLAVYATNPQAAGDVLEKVSQPAEPERS